jgi:hypothetical protein
MSNKVCVVRFKELDIEKHLVIHKPVLNSKTNIYNALFLYNDIPFILETPYLKNPFGVTKYQKGMDKVARSITIMSSGTYTDTQEVITHFFNQLKKIDEVMIIYGEKYSEMLFGKKMTKDEVKDIYESGVRGKLDKNGIPYPDKISPKVLEDDETKNPKIVVFKNTKVPLTINSWEDFEKIIEAGTSLRAIIQPRLFFMKNKFGIVYEYHQIKLPSIITKSDIKMGTYSFSE